MSKKLFQFLIKRGIIFIIDIMKEGVFMSEVERIISNVNATMEMENMPLTDDDKDMLKSCLEGKVMFDDMLNSLVSAFSREKVM